MSIFRRCPGRRLLIHAHLLLRRMGLKLTLQLEQDFLFVSTLGLILDESSISDAQRGKLVV